MRAFWIFVFICANIFWGLCVPRLASAQDTGPNELGWCTVQHNRDPEICVQSPYEACRLQMVSYAPHSKLGPTKVHDNRKTAGCSWQLVSPDLIRPAVANHKYEFPYTVIGGVCQKGGNSEPDSNCGNSAGGDNNNTEDGTPRIGNPIHLLTGAKIQHVTDYVSSDGLMSLSRVYHSHAYGGSPHLYRHEDENYSAGIGAKWALSTAVSIKIYSYNKISINKAGGQYIQLDPGENGTYYAMENWWLTGSQKVGWRGEHLSQNPDTQENHYKIIDPNGTEYHVRGKYPTRFDLNGLPLRLYQIKYAGGYVQNYHYSAVLGKPVLSSISDNQGRTMQFVYKIVDYKKRDANGNVVDELEGYDPVIFGIKAVIFPDGSSVSYDYASLDDFNIQWQIPELLKSATRTGADGSSTTRILSL